jgi:hypothetical protein
MAAAAALLAAACSGPDELVGRWDCTAVIGTSIFTFNEDSSFLVTSRAQQAQLVETSAAGKWKRSGNRLDLEVETAPDGARMKPGTVEPLEIVALNQSVFRWRGRSGKETTCRRQPVASGG